MNKKFNSAVIGGMVCCLVLFLWLTGGFEYWENAALDLRMHLRGPQPVSQAVAVIAYDEHSIASLGRWPWRRSVHARAIDAVSAAGARAIVFDMLLPEPDREHPADDAALAAAIGRSNRVVLNAYFNDYRSESNDEYIAPLSLFSAAARLTGFANILPDGTDGITRRVSLLRENRADIVPSLSLAAVAVYRDLQPEQVVEHQRIRFSDRGNSVRIGFSGLDDPVLAARGTYFPVYSFVDVVRGDLPAAALKDRIVIFGGTAAALFDQKNTPFVKGLHGVFIHAEAVSNLLTDSFIREGSWWLTLLCIILCAAVPVITLKFMSPVWAMAAVAGAFAAYSWASYAALALGRVHLEYAAPAASMGLSFVGALLYRFWVAERDKRWIKKKFGQYVSPRVMESILADPHLLSLGGRRATISVLFSDIRGFTSLSEKLPPEEVVSLLNEYLSEMVQVVFKHDGTLDKFIGDAVMAFWGAPAPQEDHARRAVTCALEMMERLYALRAKWTAEGRPLVDIGIGINSGPVVVGNIGSDQKREYTVIGDNVNLASRLEGLNKDHASHIIISEHTHALVHDMAKCRPLGQVQVKGKQQPVTIYEVIAHP